MDIIFNNLLESFLIILGSYLICKLGNNKVVNFLFGSILGFVVLSMSFRGLLDFPLVALVIIGFSFASGYSIVKATK